MFDGLLCRGWPFLPPNCVTLWITLIIPSLLIFCFFLLNFCWGGVFFELGKDMEGVFLYLIFVVGLEAMLHVYSLQLFLHPPQVYIMFS